MIEAHAMDAWTRVADRNTRAFADLTILGGFAAPLFLWLARLGVVLSATRTAERTGSRILAVDAVCRRGLEIFVLAFLFRLQAFIVSPGGHPVTLFRVDVLNVMGPAIVVAGLAWALSGRAVWRVLFFAALAAGVAMATPLVRASPGVELLPIWVQWYVRPAGDLTAFTLFPWAGFVFSGAAVGALMVAAQTADADRRLRLAIGVAGAVLIAVGFYTAGRPSIYAVPASFWTSSPTWFAVRVGIMMVALAGLSAIPVRRESTHEPHPGVLSRALVSSWQRPIATMGRASLFVYWIHVELVYGYASWLWRHRLPVWASVGAWALFTALMYRAVVARDQYLARRSAEFVQPVTVSQA
jgi:uncharacterized membrane protein